MHPDLDRRLARDMLISGALILLIMSGLFYVLLCLSSPITELERCAISVSRLPVEVRARLLGRPLGARISYLDGERWCSIVGPREGYRRAGVFHEHP